MDSDLQKIEKQLQGLCPAGLDDAFLDRLTGAVAGNLKVTAVELRPVEAVASKLQPSSLSESLTKRLTDVVEQVPFPIDEKVVLFPRGSATLEDKKARHPKWWAAAAAVALAGGISALMMSPPKEDVKVAKALPVVPSRVDSGAFVPASYNSGVSDTDDLGVMWTDGRKPVRVVRVVYKDVLRLLNEKGEEVEVEVPRVEYLMVPEKID